MLNLSIFIKKIRQLPYLFAFLMECHFIAASAKLHFFHLVRMKLLIAVGNIVVLAAFGAGKNHLITFADGHKLFPSLSRAVLRIA